MTIEYAFCNPSDLKKLTVKVRRFKLVPKKRMPKGKLLRFHLDATLRGDALKKELTRRFKKYLKRQTI